MPEQEIVTRELAALLGALAHPSRIGIVEELRDGERDVQTLQVALGISQARVSQHLSVLRARRIVAERREGRHVYYHLEQPEIAAWLIVGLRYVEAAPESLERLRSALSRVRALWPETPALLENGMQEGR
jgi:DNA-binding transcriptional ArsR family regulator